MEYRTTTLKKSACLLPLAAGIFSLLSCGTSGNDKGAPAQAYARAPLAAPAKDSTACDKYNIRYMHEVYDKADVDSLAKIFSNHFQVAVGGDTVQMKDILIRIPWKTIADAQKTVAKTDKPVRGIYINYGLDGDKFHPIFEFMYPDPTNGDLQLFPGSAFSFDGTVLKPEPDPKKYTDAYFKDIRVARTDSVFSTLKNTGDEPDPLGIWYPYADKLNDLLAQNPVKDTVLVVSCVCQQLCYGALASLPAPRSEFRHLLAFYVADGGTDQLITGGFDPSQPFAQHAMDLGHVCPPCCSTGKP